MNVVLTISMELVSTGVRLTDETSTLVARRVASEELRINEWVKGNPEGTETVKVAWLSLPSAPSPKPVSGVKVIVGEKVRSVLPAKSTVLRLPFAGKKPSGNEVSIYSIRQ